MNLTRHLKENIVKQFKAGESVDTISRWYEKPPLRIEQVIREVLIAQDKPKATDEAE